MKVNINIEASEVIQGLLDVYGDEYDTLEAFIRACTTARDIEFYAGVDDSDVFAELSDDQIKSEYDLRFDQDEDRDVIAGVEELARGNHALARTLFDRAGQEELSRAI